jgi:hypothetical protein
MKEKYKDYLLDSSIYKVYNGKSESLYYKYYDQISKYYYSVDFVESEEDIKAKKIATERERKIDLILS